MMNPLPHALPSDLDPARLPHHVAVIMDGNGRWAAEKGLPRLVGHQQGTATLKELLYCCRDWGIRVLTVYAFSTENWRRPPQEVDFLLRLLERKLRQELGELVQQGVRIRFIGELSALPRSLQAMIQDAEEATRTHTGIEFNVAVNYGGRNDILHACQRLAEKVQQGILQPQEITVTHLESYLDSAGIPDPDLLIRTSGEMRLSNFLLWQLAYAELVFSPVFWPDFSRPIFHQALLEFQRRQRRFGQLDPAPRQGNFTAKPLNSSVQPIDRVNYAFR